MVALNYYCDCYACCDYLYYYVDVVDTSCPSNLQFHQYTHQYYLQLIVQSKTSLYNKQQQRIALKMLLELNTFRKTESFPPTIMEWKNVTQLNCNFQFFFFLFLFSISTARIFFQFLFLFLFMK